MIEHHHGAWLVALVITGTYVAIFGFVYLGLSRLIRDVGFTP
jgi:hypothetical protein